MTAAEKREAIRLVEESDLSARRTLRELQIPCTTFHRWYRRYRADGFDGLTPQPEVGESADAASCGHLTGTVSLKRHRSVPFGLTTYNCQLDSATYSLRTRMLRLMRNRLSGSYLFFTSTRRSKFVPYVARMRDSPSSVVWKLI